MSHSQQPTLSPREVVSVLQRQRLLWITPTIALTLLAATYTLVRSVEYKASQALLVRDEAIGALNRQGRFENADAMKTAQETLLEIAKNQSVVGAALRRASATPNVEPTPDEVAELQSVITMTAPKGAEFGRTEVIYLSVTADSKPRALKLTAALCDELELQLQHLRDQKAESLVDELTKTVSLAEVELNRVTTELAAMETEVGSDLGELRTLNDSGAGDSTLRTALNQIKNELRQAGTVYESNQQQLNLLIEAQKDPNQLVGTPNRLLESQPSLRRLKDGLVDAQLRTAQLLGKMNADHPEVRTATANEEAVRQQLRDELKVAVRGLKDELSVNETLIATLQRQLADVEVRLNRLAGLRARYGNLVADVRQRGENLQSAQKDLTNARASRAAAHSASLITRLEHPVAANNPIGPTDATIILTGSAGGLATGLGLVFLLTPGGPLRGRRWSDYLPMGRRGTDRLTGRRAGELPNTPAEVAKDPIVKDPNGDRRSGDERRSHPPGGKQAGESRTSELPPSEAPRADASATGDHRMQSPVRRDK